MSNTLQREVPESEERKAPEVLVRTTKPPVPATDAEDSRASADSKILRFAKSERAVHWFIGGPFLLCYATGLALALIYNPDPSRPLRSVFAILHRVSGVALLVLPMLAVWESRGDVRIHFYNIKQAWTWMYDDFRWLALMGLAAISSKFKLPEQGKFNAAEKLNFMVLMATYPLYIVTGLLMWLTHLAVLSWILHFFMAMLATPLILGHLYMSLINRSTRQGLEGMITGQVDRQWAKHHYRRWYREHHEASEEKPSCPFTFDTPEDRENPCQDSLPPAAEAEDLSMDREGQRLRDLRNPVGIREPID